MHKQPDYSPPFCGSPNQEPLTREMAQKRAREIARRAGRGPAAVSQLDYELAKRDLTGTSDLVRQEELLTPTPAGPLAEPKNGARPEDAHR